LHKYTEHRLEPIGSIVEHLDPIRNNTKHIDRFIIAFEQQLSTRDNTYLSMLSDLGMFSCRDAREEPHPAEHRLINVC